MLPAAAASRRIAHRGGGPGERPGGVVVERLEGEEPLVDRFQVGKSDVAAQVGTNMSTLLMRNALGLHLKV